MDFTKRNVILEYLKDSCMKNEKDNSYKKNQKKWSPRFCRLSLGLWCSFWKEEQLKTLTLWYIKKEKFNEFLSFSLFSSLYNCFLHTKPYTYTISVNNVALKFCCGCRRSRCKVNKRIPDKKWLSKTGLQTESS